MDILIGKINVIRSNHESLLMNNLGYYCVLFFYWKVVEFALNPWLLISRLSWLA